MNFVFLFFYLAKSSHDLAEDLYDRKRVFYRWQGGL